MSRCFPYPPPGFEKSLASIEPIKIRKESEKAEKERKKEKKREKKEKKEKARGNKEWAETEKPGHKKRPYSELTTPSTQKTADSAKAREDDSEQLEKSSLTEERGGPAAVQSLCDSSDSTQNSSKRSKHESAGVIRIAQGGGNGLRIRLPLSRHRDAESPLSGERPCSSARSDTTVPPRQETHAAARVGQPPSSSVDDQPCFSGRTSAAPPSLHQDAAARSEPASVEPPIASGASQHQKSVNATGSCRVHRSHRRSGGGGSRDRETRRLYKKLILEWSPPPLEAAGPEEDDQDWLFAGRTGDTGGRGRQQGAGGIAAGGGGDAGLGGALCSWPPRACLLPEVGVYALPYVVPF